MPGAVGVVDTGPDNGKIGVARQEATLTTAEEGNQEESGKEERNENGSEAGNTNMDGSKEKKKKPSFKAKVKNLTRNVSRMLPKEINSTEDRLVRQNAENDPESQAATSPALSIRSFGTFAGSPLSPSSPQDSVKTDSPFQREKHGHCRTLSDPTGMGTDAGETSGSFRRSLRLPLNKRKDKEPKPHLQNLSDTIKEESSENIMAAMSQELSESYELPEVPENPLSIMQINTLIGAMQLEDAHLNLLALRLELQKELEEKGNEDSSIELAKKEKDLNLLYSALKEKMQIIVKDSNNQSSCSTELLVTVVRIIQEEEKREGDLGSAGWNWRDTWKEAVQEGVQAKIQSVPLDSKEENKSWLAVHLGLLGKAVLEDLEKVKNQLKGSYPPSFDVFNTYVQSYQKGIAEHLKKVSKKELEPKDCFALLNWVVNTYKSEDLMSSPTLQPDMNTDNVSLPLEDGFLDQLKDSYCHLIKEDIKRILGIIIKLQADEGWKAGKEPEVHDGFYDSNMDMDIWTPLKSYCKNSKSIDEDLETRAVRACLEELQPFPHRFEEQFNQWCKTLTDASLEDKYRVAYINNFMALKGHLQENRGSSPQLVEQLAKNIDSVVNSLGLTLIGRFQAKIKPFLGRMMTRKWLLTDEDFRHIVRRTEDLSELSRRMKPPYVQTFGSKVHYFVVKEYVAQLMKNNFSCRNGRNKDAERKMNKQWAELEDIFTELKSDATWLHPLGEHLCSIIGQKNKKEIKNCLQPLVRDYPDISQKHLSAVLYFRGMVRGRERQLILHRLGELKKTMQDPRPRGQALFSDIQVDSRGASRKQRALHTIT
ncbi:exocyst complex component 3-like protein 4 [Arapaima gigas]